MSNGSQLASASKGQGNGGNILIMADGQVSFGSFSAVLSSIESKAVGNSGDILISSGSLSFAGGSQIGSAATGEGSAGNVSIDVDGKIIFDTGSSINSSVTAGRDSTGGDINIEAGELQVLGNSQFVSALQGQGNAGNISINVDGQVVFDNSRAFGIIAPNAEGDGGNIKIRANSLRLSNNSGISSSSFGRGSSGGISITANRRVELVSGSAALSSTAPGAIGNGGDINIEAGSLLVSDNSQIASNSQGRGDAGSVLIYVRDEAIFANNSSVLSSIEPGATGRGGDIVIRAESLNLAESSLISRSTGEGVPGDIRVSASRRLLTRNGEISTISTSTPGGSLFISANQIQLEQDSDISSRTFDRISDGGNVTIVADGFIIALDDSDIVAAAFQGKGGDVTLQTPGFFGQNFTPAPFGADPDTVDGNGRVDINATGSISGVVTVPGVSFLENDLTSLPDTLIASDPLVALSCISRAEDGQGTLINIGNGGLANSPSSDLIVPLSTGTVQAMPNSMATSAGIASDEAEVSIVEPTEIYRLADGRLVMSRECP